MIKYANSNTEEIEDGKIKIAKPINKKANKNKKINYYDLFEETDRK